MTAGPTAGWKKRLAEMYRSYAALALDQGRLSLARELLSKSLTTRLLQPRAALTCSYWIRTALRLALGRPDRTPGQSR